jgi:hypothetical protein
MIVELRISDPWEFGEYLGWRTLESIVLREDHDAWLVELVAPFRYHDTEYHYIVVTSRHHETELSQICVGTEISCNMTLTTRERANSDRACDISWWRGGHAIIGNVCMKR